MVALNSSPLFSSLFPTGMPGIGGPDAEAVAAQAQRAVWLLSSRPGGLGDSISKLLR